MERDEDEELARVGGKRRLSRGSRDKRKEEMKGRKTELLSSSLLK